MSFPVLFRTWSPRRTSTDNCTIVEAVLATCATPGIIAGVEIKGESGLPLRYGGSDLRWNNPVANVWEEAEVEFPSHTNEIEFVVSIGTGKESVIGIQTSSQIAEVLKKLARDCELASDNASRHCKSKGWKYIRLNVDGDLQDMAWKEWETHGGLVEIHTKSYLKKEEVNKELARLVLVPLDPPKTQ